jgi:hypothetical protein
MRVIWYSIVIFYNSFLFAKNTISYHPACWLNLVYLLMMLLAFYLEGKTNEQKTEIENLTKEYEQAKQEYLKLFKEANNVV